MTDPSDWNDTLVPELREIDSLSRCYICKEYFNAPVLTSCNHTFCSQCIRASLISKQQCPLCKAELFETNLSRNILLEELVRSFSEVRHKLHEVLSQNGGDGEGMEKAIDKAPSDDEVIEVIPPDHVQCPVCADYMSADELQRTHIEECLGGKKRRVEQRGVKRSGEKKPITSFFKRAKVSSDFYFKQAENHHSTERRLPKLDFSSLTTPKVKEKLAAVKLPTTGTRQQMEQRYNQYYVLYNSNLDSNRPEPVATLRQRLHEWEVSLRPKQSLFGKKLVGVGDKEFSRRDWLEKNKKMYAMLVREAKGRIKEKRETGSESAEKECGNNNREPHQNGFQKRADADDSDDLGSSFLFE